MITGKSQNPRAQAPLLVWMYEHVFFFRPSGRSSGLVNGLLLRRRLKQVRKARWEPSVKWLLLAGPSSRLWPQSDRALCWGLGGDILQPLRFYSEHTLDREQSPFSGLPQCQCLSFFFLSTHVYYFKPTLSPILGSWGVGERQGKTQPSWD